MAAAPRHDDRTAVRSDLSGTSEAVLTYRDLAVWVGLGGKKPSGAALAAYAQRELENAEELDAVDAAVAREMIRALRDHDELVAALDGLLRCCEQHPAFNSKKNSITRDRMLAARAALAKAEAQS